MTTSEFKKVGRLLKEVYAELEKEAIRDGVDIFSEEYLAVRDAVRVKVLERLGFTHEEYVAAKELVAPAKKIDVATKLENVATQIDELSGKTGELSERVQNLHIPNEDEILERTQEMVQKEVKPPVIQNNIVERTIVEKPTIIKETVNEEYDDLPIVAEIGYLNDRLNNLKIPDVDSKIEALKNEMRSDFMRELEHNINTLNMPDFRKLAMGLQAQIDEVRNTPPSGDIILQSPDGTNWQIGITNNGELTATSL